MRHNFRTFVLIIVALFSLFTAWSSGMAPAKFAQQLGLSVANAGGFNEIRAQYSGFFLAVAVVCIASLADMVARQPALIVVAVVFGGLIGGRLVSLGLNRGVAGYGPTILALYAIDATGFVLAITAMMLENKG
jgi:hypothetical protein